MRNPNFLHAFSLLFVLSILSPAASVTVRVLGTPVVGQILKVEIISAGDVAVENPLAVQTQLLKGQGQRVANLGVVKSIGFYSFRFFTQDTSENVLVPVLGDTGYVSKPIERPKAQEDALLKFARLHTEDSLKAAWTDWAARDEVMKQTVNLITAGTLVFICPFEVVACGYVPAAVGDLALSFGVAFEIAHAETLFKQKKLTAAELAEIKRAFQNFVAVKSLLSAKDRWEVAFATASTTVDLISNRDLQLTAGLMNDQAKKTHTLVMMVKKLPKP